MATMATATRTRGSPPPDRRGRRRHPRRASKLVSAAIWSAEFLGTGEDGSPHQLYLGPREDGWVGIPFQHKGEFQPGSDRWEAYLERVETIRDAPEITDELTTAGLAFFEQLSDTIRALGARPIFVMGPTTNRQRQLLSAHAQGHIDHLLALNRPEEFPELFDTGVRWNASYLNTDGARVFSSLLAEHFLGPYGEKSE